MLPSQLAKIDDAGVFFLFSRVACCFCVEMYNLIYLLLSFLGVLVTLFVPLSLLLYFFRNVLLGDGHEQDIFDRRRLHDALTIIKERDEQIKV